MLTALTDPLVPPVLRNVLLVDGQGLPRYWSSIWALLTSADLAKSSQVKRLRYVDALYIHADQTFGSNSLDDALGRLDDHLLGAILESWFVSIRNRPLAGPADEARWRTGHSFVTATLELKLKTAVEMAEAKPSSSIGRTNQIEHARTRLQGVRTLLAAEEGDLPFPDGPDLSVPRRTGVMDG